MKVIGLLMHLYACIFQVEIVKGSGVCCKRDTWKASMNAGTATAVVRMLLLGTFPLETLLQSNLNGKIKLHTCYPF